MGLLAGHGLKVLLVFVLDGHIVGLLVVLVWWLGNVVFVCGDVYVVWVVLWVLTGD